MTIAWKDLTFQFKPSLSLAASQAWGWLIPKPWTTLVCSKVGGVFLDKRDGSVHWLDTGTGLVEAVANSRAQFDNLLRTSPDLIDEWFLPALVEKLHAAGKKAGADECYGFGILPVFAEGRYEVDNMFVIPCTEQLVGMADVHRQLSEHADGAAIQVKVVD
jgi:hypothetical protein